MSARDRIAFVTSATPEAESAREALVRRYGDVTPDDADVIVALGGDGLMLQTLHKFMEAGKPIYGMNRGTVGFLMNEYREDGLKERIAAAKETVIHPLTMRAIDERGVVHEARAINEVSLFRQTYQLARLRILIDGNERLPELAGRRPAGGDAGRIDRLQSLGPRTDHPDRRAAAGAHADQPVPAAALARRAAARQRGRRNRGARSRQAPGCRCRRP